tara:strand:- start:1931 stop:2350 length:420 start_codon:yes stop_codon:yes gene_type:complete
MGVINVTKELIAAEDLNTGTGTATRTTSTGGSQTVNKINVSTLVAGATTFGAQDATPSVSGNYFFKTANTVPTTITNLIDGTAGQVIWVVFGDALTTIEFTGTSLKGNVGADWSPASGDHMQCIFDGTSWYCSVSDNTA